MSSCLTTSQTVGPFFEIGFELLLKPDIAAPDAPGERVTLEGRVLDGDRAPIPDAVIEIWQANSQGQYADSSFRGYGRVSTNDNGYFRFRTIKPGTTPGPDGKAQAPHLEISILMRGLLKRLITRVYFPGDPANASDPILQLVPPGRRQSLVAQKSDEGLLHWDVCMQGDDETVFFDV